MLYGLPISVTQKVGKFQKKNIQPLEEEEKIHKLPPKFYLFKDYQILSLQFYGSISVSRLQGKKCFFLLLLSRLKGNLFYINFNSFLIFVVKLIYIYYHTKKHN